MTAAIDIDHLRQWVGRTQEASDTVTAQLVKALRATLFLDIGTPQAGDTAPLTTHWCLAQPVAPTGTLPGLSSQRLAAEPWTCEPWVSIVWWKKNAPMV